jgi:hypothetical protein
MAKFVHIRNRDKEGKLLPHGGFTVAYETINTESGKYARYAVAKCSKLDAYNRKRGAMIAKGRLERARHDWMTSIPPNERPVDVVVGAVYSQSGGLRLLPR